MVNDEIIKVSFAKVKQHIDKLENEIFNQNKQINDLKEKIEVILNEIKEKKQETTDFTISTRNNGVKQINKQINKQMIKQLSTSLNTDIIEKALKNQFKSLTQQELKTFLTIYQIEDEKGKPASYDEISKSMGLSTSCIRAYVINLIKKNIPILKEKYKNKTSLFTIKKDFRKLNIKDKLVDLYYDPDNEQTKLLDI